MPRRGDSPWPFALGDCHHGRSSRYPGARRGEIAWSRSLGPTRTGPWTALARILVRGDGTILTDWQGVLRGHRPDGEGVLRLDLLPAAGPERPHLLPQLLLVDREALRDGPALPLHPESPFEASMPASTPGRRASVRLGQGSIASIVARSSA